MTAPTLESIRSRIEQGHTLTSEEGRFLLERYAEVLERYSQCAFTGLEVTDRLVEVKDEAARLRAVVGSRFVTIGTDATGWPLTVLREALECGHTLPPASGIMGRRCPARRRCRKCAAPTPEDRNG